MDYRGLSGILEELHLLLVILEDWILIQRASIDIHINEEPYHSIQVYANTMTKRYVIRAWGKSIRSGHLATIEDLKELCKDYFGKFVACAGYLGPHPGQGLDLVRVSYPCTRWISRSCAVTFAHDQEALIIGLCPACSGEDLMKKEEEMESANDQNSLPMEEKKPFKSQKCKPKIISEKAQEKQDIDSIVDHGEPDEPILAPEENHGDDSDDETWSPPKPIPKEIKVQKKPKPKIQNSENRLALSKKRRRLRHREKENGMKKLLVRNLQMRVSHNQGHYFSGVMVMK